MLFFILAVVSTLATKSAVTPPLCVGSITTEEINQCMLKASAVADAELQRYSAVALARLRKDAKMVGASSEEASTPEAFQQAEMSWRAYRDKECGAVFSYWSGGTIRGYMDEACRIRLTLLHTHTVWREGLTYMDSTPPLLPEPVVTPDP